MSGKSLTLLRFPGFVNRRHSEGKSTDWVEVMELLTAEGAAQVRAGPLVESFATSPLEGSTGGWLSGF